MPANDDRHGPTSRRALIKTISIAAAAIGALALAACTSTATPAPAGVTGTGAGSAGTLTGAGNYLSSVDPAWAAKVGAGKTLN